MKKLVIKTTLITLASLIGALCVAFGATAIFAPGFTAGIFDGVGNYSASVFFYEKQYNKTQSFSDLNVLVDKVDYQNDKVRAEKYLQAFVEHQEFSDFCKDSQGVLTNKEYYVGNYALVLLYNGKFDVALSVAKTYVSQSGYTEYNPYRKIIYDFSNISSAQLTAVKDELSTLAQTEIVKTDIENINQQLG